jgi:hypothetical protein
MATTIYYTDRNFSNKLRNEMGLLDEYYYHDCYSVCLLSMCNLVHFKNYLNKNSILKNFTGIKLTNNKIDQTTLISLLQYYLILNNYYIYNDNIYEKIKESKISYKCIGSLMEVLYDKFQDNVVFYYVANFELYFKGFDFNHLLNNYFIKSKGVIESLKDISTQRIEPNFGLIEFTDGVYSIKYDRFFSNKTNYTFSGKISTIKYYNKSYE